MAQGEGAEAGARQTKPNQTKPNQTVPGVAAKASAPVTLEECEDRIERGKQAFLEVGRALATINEKRLYLETGCKTFAEYCKARWDFGKTYGYRLIAAFDVVNQLPARVSTLVENEVVAGALADVPKGERVRVLRKAAKAGPVTAKAIRKAVAPVTIDVDPEPEKITKRHPCPACGGTGFAE